MTKTNKQDRACEQCGTIHKNGVDWHGRCYSCGGELVPVDLNKLERIAVTPGGLELFQEKPQPHKLQAPKTATQLREEISQRDQECAMIMKQLSR